MSPGPEQILSEQSHRPYPISTGPWVMRQSWRRPLFAHWRIPLAELRRVVPQPLVIDTFNSEAWIAIVPFRMHGVSAHYTPLLPWVSDFLEINVRTYVIVDGQPGVYFFSLDAANPLAVEVARRVFHLPYYRARMRMREDGPATRYLSKRTHRRAASANLDVTYDPIGPAAATTPGTLEHWFVERYCLGTVHRGKTVIVEIHHAPWIVQPAAATFRVNSMTSWLGIELPDEAPHLLFAGDQDVLTWMPRRV